MKKLMLALMAAQAMTLALPVAAHADVVDLRPSANLQPIAAPVLYATITPSATVNAFSGR